MRLANASKVDRKSGVRWCEPGASVQHREVWVSRSFFREKWDTTELYRRSFVALLAQDVEVPWSDRVSS